jgi:hypothetical protein
MNLLISCFLFYQCVAFILLFFITQVLGTQVALMKNLPSILPCLVLVLPVLDVAQASASIFQNLLCSVADPDPDPSDSYVFGPPGSGSGSFNHQAKIIRKP